LGPLTRKLVDIYVTDPEKLADITYDLWTFMRHYSKVHFSSLVEERGIVPKELTGLLVRLLLVEEVKYVHIE
jgi:hypothetical protein